MTIIRPTTINARFSQPVGLGGEKLWLCPTLGGDRLDLSGNRNHGTYNGGMGTVVDKYKGSKAYKFDGVDDRIALQSSSVNTVFCGSNSISLWSKISGNLFTADGNATFVGHDSTATTWYNFSYMNGSNVVRSYADNGADNGLADATSGYLEDNQWRHLVCIRDYESQLVKFYMQGSLIGSVYKTTTAPASITANAYVGYSSLYGYSGGPNGNVFCFYDDIRFFDRVLTPSEIKHLASYRGVLGSPRQPYDPLKRTVVRVPAAIPAATKVGSIKKPTTIAKPSYQAGYARNASESENPQLWDGLVGAWMPSLGVTGDTLRDVSGNGNHGTLTNFSSVDVAWERTKGNQSLSFTGVNMAGDFRPSQNYALVQESLMLLRDICCELWIKPKSLSKRGIVADGAPSSPKFALTLLTNGKIETYRGSNTQSGFSVPSQSWSHVVVQTIGDVTSYYLNGKFSNSASQPYTSSGGTGTYIGANYWGGLDGYLSRFSIYNRALSPSEIKQLYVDSLAPFRRKQRVSVAVPAATPTPSATYHPLRSLAHPLEQ